jgi:5-methylcytosine-specific restriction endonuclease McrA
MDKPNMVTIRCSRCECDLPVEAFFPSNRRQGDWCRACRKEYMRAYSAARYVPRPREIKPKAPRQPRPLTTHGAKPSGGRWRRLQEEVWATESHCGICGEYVDQDLPHNNLRARSIDHILPIAWGGAMYERSNVRLAHRTCNSKAGSHLRNERAALARAALWLGDQL